MPLLFQLMVTAVVVVGASARITRLVGADTITEPLRSKLTSWTKSTKPAAFLVCPWCSGFWISVVVTWIAWLVNGFPFADPQYGFGAVGLALGTSYLVGLLAEFEDEGA